MVIDFHTHAFPDAVAQKALNAVQAAENIEPCTDGTVNGSIKKLKADGVDFGVVCSIATNARQLPKVNSFAIDINDFSRSLIALGTAHPDSDILEDELQRVYDHDIKGIKIHPEYANYYIDSPEWDKVFSICEEMGLFVITHAGLDMISPDRVAATPDRLAKVLDRHKKLTLVAAHLGGISYWEQVYDVLCGRDNLYMDTAILNRQGADPSIVRDIIVKHGDNKILFGSDMPWSEPKDELSFISSLGLDEKSMNKILFENAQKLLF